MEEGKEVGATMKEAFDLIKERLEAKEDDCGCGKITVQSAINIVSEVEAEYINKSTEYIKKLSDCSSGWIPCSERMPEDFQSVLCYAKSLARRPDTMFVGSQKHGFWFLQSSIGTESFPTQYEVLAWMPLPESYKPEKGVKDGKDKRGLM